MQSGNITLIGKRWISVQLTSIIGNSSWYVLCAWYLGLENTVIVMSFVLDMWLNISLQVWLIWCLWGCCLLLTASVFFCWTHMFWWSCCGRMDVWPQRWHHAAAPLCHLTPPRNVQTSKSVREYSLFWPTLESLVSFCYCYQYCFAFLYSETEHLYSFILAVVPRKMHYFVLTSLNFVDMFYTYFND